MKSLLAHFALRDAGYGRSQSDRDTGATTRRHFYINVRSIRWPPEIDQRQSASNANIEEKVSAFLVPEETRNYMGKAFFETWCHSNGHCKPEIDIVWLEFTLDGQTQRFETVHQIIDNGESVQFYSNRSSAKPHRRSLLEDHIQEHYISLQKRHGYALPKEVVAIRSRTWPLRRWPRFSGIQHTRKKQHDKPVIRLGEEKYHVYARQHRIDAGDVADGRVETRESLAQYTSGDNLRGNPPAMMTNPPFVMSSRKSPPENDPAELRCAASSGDPLGKQDSYNHSLIETNARLHKDLEPSREVVLSLNSQDLDTRLNENVRDIRSFHLTQNILAGSDPPSLDGPQIARSAAEHHRENNTSATSISGRAVPLMVVRKFLDSQTQTSSTPDEVSVFKESQTRSQSKVASQQLQQSSKVHSSSLDNYGSEPGLTMGSPDSSESTTCTGKFGCESIITDIYRNDRRMTRELEKQPDSGGGNLGGEIHDSMTQEASQVGRPGYQEPYPPANEPHELDSISVRKGETPSIAKQSWPASTLGATDSPIRGVGGSHIPGTQNTNAATASSSKEVAEFGSSEQRPDNSNEVDTWDFCHDSDQPSVLSSDGEGLPFPDDYWIYDKEAENHYHVEVADDGTRSISWYPLEFD